VEIKIEGFGGRPPFGGRPGALGPMSPPLNPAMTVISATITHRTQYIAGFSYMIEQQKTFKN